MGWDTPGQAMRDMSAVHPKYVQYTAADDARGDTLLEPTIENGVKVFNLEANVVRWNILPDVQVEGYAFNKQIPGPRLRVTEGDRVRIRVTNHLPESTTVHWHGLIVPNEMDGPANITQKPIEPGGTFIYEFTTEQAGTFFYHTHDHADRQQALGLYGALIIDPKESAQGPKADHEYVVQLQEWLERQGLTYPAMLMEGGLPELLHDQRQSLSVHRHGQDEGRRVDQVAFHRHQQQLHPPHARPRRTVHGRRTRWLHAGGGGALRGGHGQCGAGPALRRDLEGTSSGEVDRALPYPAPHDEQQRRAQGRRWADDDPGSRSMSSGRHWYPVCRDERCRKIVDKEQGKVTIKHGPLRNLEMPAMTMVFRVKDPAMLDRLKEGDKIRFVAERVDGTITVVESKPYRASPALGLGLSTPPVIAEVLLGEETAVQLTETRRRRCTTRRWTRPCRNASMHARNATTPACKWP